MTKIELILMLLVVLLIVLTITLYFLQKKRQEQLVETQTDMLKQHAEEVENIYRQMRGWRHDYKNHIQSMKAYLELDQLPQLENYLADLSLV